LNDNAINSHYHDDISNLGMLSIVRLCCIKSDFIFKNQLMIAKNMATTALSIYKNGGPLQKIMALKICKLVFPSVTGEDIEAITLMVNSEESSSSSIIYYFINEIGRLVGYSDNKVYNISLL